MAWVDFQGLTLGKNSKRESSKRIFSFFDQFFNHHVLLISFKTRGFANLSALGTSAWYQKRVLVELSACDDDHHVTNIHIS